MNFDGQGGVSTHQEFRLIAYNNLVYLIRAVSNVTALGVVGGLGATSGLLVDTFVPTKSGNLALAQSARYKRSGLAFFGDSYTPTTMIDSLDTLDFTSITGDTFYAPTIFIPISDIDADKGFVADLSNFLGQQIWTLIYPEIVAAAGRTVNGVPYPNGHNIDVTGKPILSVQKLHFVYDPLAVMFTPNDLTHKYALLPKQQILALTNGQIEEGICWRSANPQPQRDPPTNICAQSILPFGWGMDRPNIIYSPGNRSVTTPISDSYKGMSVHRIRSLAGVVYNIEESALSLALTNDQAGSSFISAVSSVANMLIGVLFEYDNDDLGTLVPYSAKESTKGLVFINGYLGAAGYAFSSPDHFDVNDVLPCQVPLLEQVAGVLGWDVAFYDMDPSLPRQFWSMAYDTFTAPGLPNFVPNLPPSVADPGFTNRTRSLILSIQNPVRPQQLGLMDTFSSVVSANLHLQNGVTGSIFLNKKADRDVVSSGTNPAGPSSLYGLPTKYDFFIFSRDHYGTLKGANFELIDEGYAMCLVDDGTGTGTKVAKYYIDQDGNYNELFTYALFYAEWRHHRNVKLYSESHARRAGQPERQPGHSGNTQQRQSAGSGHADQQSLQPDLRGFRALRAGAGAGLYSDPGGAAAQLSGPTRERHPGGADHGTSRLQRLQPERGRNKPAAGADFANIFRYHNVSDRRFHNDHSCQHQLRQSGAVLRVDLARPGPAAFRARSDRRRVRRQRVRRHDRQQCSASPSRASRRFPRRVRSSRATARSIYTFNTVAKRSWIRPANRSRSPVDSISSTRPIRTIRYTAW